MQRTSRELLHVKAPACEGELEVGMLEGLRIGHCACDIDSKGNTVKHEVEREGKGPHCEGPFMAMIMSSVLF